MARIDVMGWPFRSPRWLETFILIGLITLIPIVGVINLYGWMLTCVDNFRAGRLELPPAGFYLERGWRMFVVVLVYQLVPVVLILILMFAFFAGLSFGTSAQSGAVAGGFAVVIFILYGLIFVVALVLQGLVPLLALATDQRGVAGALNPMVVVGWVQARPGPVLIAALLGLAAHFLSQIGVYLCFVGVFLSLPFGYAMMAAVIRNLEIDLATTPAPAAPAAGS